MAEEQMKAMDVREGDFLVGLGDGYVFENPEEPGSDQISIRTGSGYRDAPYVVPESYVMISFHDQNGEEGYVVVDGDSMLTVRREDRS